MTSREQPVRFQSTRFALDLVVTVVVLVAAGVVILSNWPQSNGVVLPDEPVSIEGSAARGSGNAKVILVEYADFQCPSCAGFVRTVLPRFERQYVETGLVRIVFRHFPLPQHEASWPAAIAAECAGREDKFWEMHDLAFGNQRSLTELSFLVWASQLGLERSKFQACMTATDVRRRIEADVDSAGDLHIAATPTLITGRLQPDGSVRLLEVVPASFVDLRGAVERALTDEDSRVRTRVALMSLKMGITGLAIAAGAWLWLRGRRRAMAPAPPPPRIA